MMTQTIKFLVIAIAGLAFSLIMALLFYFISDECSCNICDAIGGFVTGIMMVWVYITVQIKKKKE